MNKLKLIDRLEIDQPIRAELKDEALSIIRKDKNAGLKLNVKIDATHSGILANNRVYPGRYVSSSYKSYLSKDLGGTAEFSVPILKHHKHEEDAVGRVTSAVYIKYKEGQSFERDYANPDTEETGGKGSGVVKVGATIADIDTIEKIVDARILSVSSGQSSKYMLCNICGQDLFGRNIKEDEEACPHVPGSVYEIEDSEMLCYAVTGPLTYKEISFVNIPAQSPAKITKFDWDGAKLSDSENLIISTSSRGKKSLFSCVTLVDSSMELDLLSGKDKKTNNKVLISVSEGFQTRIDSLFGESSSFKSSSDSVEPDDSKKQDNQKLPSPDVGKSEKVSVKSVASVKNVADGHSKTSDDKASDKNVSGLDKTSNNSKEKLMDLETLKASLEEMTKKNKDLDDKVKNLTSTVEGKESEIKKLNDRIAADKAAVALDYAEIVAHFRQLLNKPDTKVIDSEDARKKYIDNLAKRSTESLKDSLADIKLEWAAAQTEADASKKKTEVDLSKDKLASPTLASKKDTSAKKLDASAALSKAFNVDGE